MILSLDPDTIISGTICHITFSKTELFVWYDTFSPHMNIINWEQNAICQGFRVQLLLQKTLLGFKCMIFHGNV